MLLLCGTAAFAGEAKAVSDRADLAAFLSSLRVGGSPAPVQAAAHKSLRNITAFDVTCTASCGSSSPVSCTTSGSCSAVDRNCSTGQQGYVECNGSYTYCPACGCPEGQVLNEDGGCCIGGRQRWIRYECVNGSWQYTGMSCSGTCF